MNEWNGIGRICNDIELKYTSGTQTAFCTITLAIDRPKRKDQEKADTDFIPVQVWGRQAENCEKFLRKGLKLAVHGRIEVTDYEDKYGNKKSYTKVNATNVEFLEYANKNDTGTQQSVTEQYGEEIADNFQMINEDVPF